MKRILLIAGALALSSAAYAQVPPPHSDPTPPTHSDPAPPPMTMPSTQMPVAPAAGANSFTEAQAKTRIEAAGFTNVTGLMKDKDGIWRGKAMKNGAAHDVALDYKGQVFPH